MKKLFQMVVEEHNRNVVVHNIIETEKMMSKFKPKDIIFFDDCTYNQYRFIKDNIETLKDHPIVLGFSTALYRDENNNPITSLTTKELHDGIHQGEENFKNGFMTISELKELNDYENIYIALHGNMHLELEFSSELKSLYDFKTELDKSILILKGLEIKTNIFVYPYDFSLPYFDDILMKNGFSHIYPSENNSRIYIEELF